MNKSSLLKFVDLNERGYALWSGILVVLLISILMAAASLRSDMHLKEIQQRRSFQEAFYASEAALNRAIFELRRNRDWRPGVTVPPVLNVRLNTVEGDDTTTIGFYSLDVAPAPPVNGWETVWVRALGQNAVEPPERRLNHVIFGRVLVENPARFLISTVGNLIVKSGATVNAEVLGQNISFEINPALPEDQRKIYVNSDIFYLNSYEGAENPDVIFCSEDPNGDPCEMIKTPALTFAGVDINRYRSIAQNLAPSHQGIYLEGDVVIDLAHLEELVENPPQDFSPLIIFAEGRVDIRGEYDHSLVVVSGNSISIAGGIIPDEDVPERPQIGLFAYNDVFIASDVQTQGGNLDLEAFILAGGGDPDSQGGVLKTLAGQGSLGTLNFTGAISVRGQSETAISLDAFRQRIYNYNQDLVDHRRIPFSPFIANLLEWKSVTIHDPFPPA